MKLTQLFAIGIVITTTTANLPPTAYWAVFGPLDGSMDTVACSTNTACSPPAVSTGPFVMRVSTDPISDCYAADGVYPNGTLINEQWMKCP